MNSDEILIIQCQIPMKPQKADDLRKRILEQKETGVILLPNYCTVVTKPKDIDIQVESQESWNIDLTEFTDMLIHPDRYNTKKE